MAPQTDDLRIEVAAHVTDLAAKATGGRGNFVNTADEEISGRLVFTQTFSMGFREAGEGGDGTIQKGLEIYFIRLWQTRPVSFRSLRIPTNFFL